MSEEETKLLEKYIVCSKRYFEFGSGGSTKLAARNNLEVYGVESDKLWVETLYKELGEYCKVSYIDIGPTKEWGYPINYENKNKFPDYHSAILQHAEPFDLILIDGRFRVACTLNSVKQILVSQKNINATRIFIHDFWDRSEYHVVLEFLDLVDKVDTAGVFSVKDKVSLVRVDFLLEKYKYTPL